MFLLLKTFNFKVGTWFLYIKEYLTDTYNDQKVEVVKGLLALNLVCNILNNLLIHIFKLKFLCELLCKRAINNN